MTDYRRPDLDLWEEEDDAEDARPTIVAERPKNQPPELPEEVTNARLRPAEPTARITTGTSARVIPAGVMTGDEVTAVRLPPLPAGNKAFPALRAQSPKTLIMSAPQIATKVELLAEQPAKAEGTPPAPQQADAAVAPSPGENPATPAPAPAESELAPRDSGEVLRNSEINALEVLDEAAEAASTSEEGELVGADEVEEVAASKPALPVPLPVPVSRDREVTERISVPGSLGSIAPTAHTMPPKREKRELGAWQLGVAAIALVAGGLGVSMLRRPAEEPVAVSAPVERERPAAPQTQAARQPSRPAALPALPTATASSSLPEAVEPALQSPAPASTVSEPSTPSAVPAVPVAPVEKPVARPATVPATAGKPLVAKSEPRRVRPAAAAPSESEEEAAEDPESAASHDAASENGLPAKPSREQVTEVLNALVPELQKCVGDRGGEAEVTLTVRSAGLVSYSVVAGQYAGTPEGSCIARAVKLAKFPAFNQPNVRITYPFRL